MSSFRSIENKFDLYRDKDCMKKFCEFSRRHAIKTIKFKRKKLNYEGQAVIFVNKNSKKTYLTDKKIS